MYFIPFSPEDKPLDDIVMPRAISDYEIELYTNQPTRLVPLMPTRISLDVKISFYTGDRNGRSLTVISNPKYALSDGIIVLDSPCFFMDKDNIMLTLMWTGANTTLNEFEISDNSILIPHGTPIAIGHRMTIEHLHRAEGD